MAILDSRELLAMYAQERGDVRALLSMRDAALTLR